MARPRMTQPITMPSAVFWSSSISFRIEKGDSFVIAKNAAPKTMIPRSVKIREKMTGSTILSTMFPAAANRNVACTVPLLSGTLARYIASSCKGKIAHGAAAIVLALAVAGCPGDPGAASSGTVVTSGTASATADTTGSASAPVVASASASAAPVPTEKDIPPIEPDAKGLRGKTVDYEYDGSDVKSKSRAYTGRIFFHEKALRSTKPVPLVIFMHGLNRDLIPHRWIGGGNEGDVRKIVSDLMESGAIPPVVLAGPGSVQKEAVSFGASFPVFDHDKFVDQVVEHSKDLADIDRTKIIVTGHSGAGCSDKGGIVPAVTAKTPPLAVISIDTCMPGSLALALGRAPPNVNIIVTWQSVSWDRDFKLFRAGFEREVKANPPAEGILRELDNLPGLPKAHDATVKQTYDKWLPVLLAK